jgi:hypothetical protein
MPGPGEYRPDPTEGIGRIEDLPKPQIRCQSRNYPMFGVAPRNPLRGKGRILD